MGFRSTTLTESEELNYLLTINQILIDALRTAGDGGTAGLTIDRPKLKDLADTMLYGDGTITL